MSSRTWPRHLAWVVGVGAAYFASAQLGLRLISPPEGVAAFWPASGVALGALLIAPSRLRPLVLLGFVVGNAAVNLAADRGIVLSIAFALVNGLESILAAWVILGGSRGRATFAAIREVLTLFAAALIANAIGATLAAIAAAAVLEAPSLWMTWRLWAMAGAVGMLAVAPAVVTTYDSATSGRLARRLADGRTFAEALLLLSCLAITAALAFRADPSAPFLLHFPSLLVFPFLLWAGLRLGPTGAASASLLVTILLVWYTPSGTGPFADPAFPLHQRVTAAQLYLGLSILSSLALAAVLRERHDAELALARERQALAREREALATERDFSSAIVDTVGSLVVVLDRGGRIVRFNHAAELVSGYAARELLGEFVWDFLTPTDEIDRVRHAFTLLRDGAQLGRYEGQWVTRSGERRIIEWKSSVLVQPDGQVDYVIGTGTDITDRRRAEAARKLSEQRLRVALRNSHVIAFSQDRDLRYTWAYNTIRVRVRQLIGKSDDEVFGPENAAAMTAFKRKVIESGESAQAEIEITLDGRRCFYDIAAEPIYDNVTGEVIGVLGAAIDLTERQELLAREQAARQAAEEANQAKDQFLAALSHELRTPLTPVLAAVSAMCGDGSLPAVAREDLELVRRNVELEARLIDDLLDLTRITRGKLELRRGPVDAHEVVRHAIGVCQTDAVAERRLRIETDLSADRAGLWADGTRLQQVFWNLIHNALKFSPDGAAVIVSSRVLQDDEAPPRIEVDVVDHGIGIEPEVLPRLFSAFEQGGAATTRRFGGLGLGLAISRAIVERHGGTIHAESEGRGRGARFIVRLPLAEVPATSDDAAPPAPEAAPARPLWILLVEDHADTARVVRRLLEGRGFGVSTARDVASAVELAEHEASRIDLVVSDLGLPDGTGLDLMRMLRRRFGLSGVCLSGFGTEQDLRNSRDAGFVAHLTKPVELSQLEAAIRQAAEARGEPAPPEREPGAEAGIVGGIGEGQ